MRRSVRLLGHVDDATLRDLLDCKISGIRVSDVSALYERSLGQISLEHVNAGWLIFGEGFRQGALRRALKRMSDIVAALMLLERWRAARAAAARALARGRGRHRDRGFP